MSPAGGVKFVDKVRTGITNPNQIWGGRPLLFGTFFPYDYVPTSMMQNKSRMSPAGGVKFVDKVRTGKIQSPIKFGGGRPLLFGTFLSSPN